MQCEIQAYKWISSSNPVKQNTLSYYALLISILYHKKSKHGINTLKYSLKPNQWTNEMSQNIKLDYIDFKFNP